MTGAARAQTSQLLASAGAVPCPVSASVAHLNVNGVAMVASLASSNSTNAPSTRSFRSPRSEGQIYGHSPAMVLIIAPRARETCGPVGRLCGDDEAIEATHIGAFIPPITPQPGFPAFFPALTLSHAVRT